MSDYPTGINFCLHLQVARCIFFNQSKDCVGVFVVPLCRGTIRFVANPAKMLICGTSRVIRPPQTND